MPKNLVIVESPAKASTIKSYLGPNYKVMASKGHIKDLPKSVLGVDIENNFKPTYINIRGKADLINELKKEAKSAAKVYLATDPDREGEAISWHLASALNIPVTESQRVTFNEITKNAVKTAIKTPRNIDMDLVNSQQARRILDRIVGYKLSPFLWQNIKSGLSAGRVQSVAARMIVEREETIRNFVPQEYWTVEAVLITPAGLPLNANFHGDAKTKNKIELKTQADADKIIKAVKNKPFTVISVKKAVRYKNPPPPFITSTLQQEAAHKLGFQSQRIMRIAQELYEGIDIGAENGGAHGLISYMRTDSTRISAEASEAAKDLITANYGNEYYPDKPRVYKPKSKSGTQDAHEAIRPADPAIEPDKIKKYLSADQYKLYKLIWSRFIASQMASAELDTVSVDIESAGYLFRSSGYTIKFKGYMTVYDNSEDSVPAEKNSSGGADNKSGGTDNKEKDGNENESEEKSANIKLPELKEGDVLKLEKITPQQHFTEPSPRFTEASLVKILEEKGIGRPSTYSPIITTIISRGYVVREGKLLKPTTLGEVTTRLMVDKFPDIVDYKFTAQMEDELDSIENGQTTMTDVLSGFYGSFKTHLDEAAQTTSKESFMIPTEETDMICDKCGSKMIVKYSKFGKFAACPNYPDCKNTKPLADDTAQSAKTDLKCELCGNDMIIRRGKFGNFYACGNYPNCKNTKPMYKEIGVACPSCGAQIHSKQSKTRGLYYCCEKYPDCKFSSWDMPLNEKCPKCGGMLYRKKGKNQNICHNGQCGYKIDVDPDQEETN